MPLSESERRDLKGLEQQLRSQDPKLAAALSARRGSGSLWKLHPLYGSAVVVIGTALLFAGLFTATTAVALSGVVAVSAGLTALALGKLESGHRLWAMVNGFVHKHRTPR